ncbi:MAG: hypothetical protein K6D38_07750 [Pseudobutyrivibrio sp.]|nr:hypothetical protein [Pseudobutyrivibrio sp.]
MKKKIAIIAIAAAVVVAAVIGIVSAGGAKKLGGNGNKDRIQGHLEGTGKATSVSKSYGGSDDGYVNLTSNIDVNTIVPGEVVFGNDAINICTDYSYVADIPLSCAYCTQNANEPKCYYYTLNNGKTRLDMTFIDDPSVGGNPRLVNYSVTGPSYEYNDNIFIDGDTCEEDVINILGKQPDNRVGQHCDRSSSITFLRQYSSTPISVDYHFSFNILDSITVHNQALEAQYRAYLY